MARAKAVQDPAVLEMALAGYELEKQKIEEKIIQIQSQLGRRRGTGVDRKGAARKRVLSAAARARIAAAQRRRWAEHRKKAAQAAKAAKA